MRRFLKRGLIALLVLGGLGWMGWRLYRGPSPEEILARIEVPPTPVLTPQEELATFRTAPGFRVELVASEPLVIDPVAMDWDERGLLYVVEMRGYMPDIEGEGEELPTGDVVVLEDTDGDGRMDRRDVFLDDLVMPRAVAVLPEGVLIGEPPHLWLCRDEDLDRRCDEKILLGEYGAEGSNPEHKESAMLPGVDNWIYNAGSSRRFRLRDGALEVQPTVRRGQFGLAQDDEGRLFYNHNSGFLYGDAVAADETIRQAAVAARTQKAGVNVPLSDGAEVFGIRVAPGLNRAYLYGTLRPDGRQWNPTGVSGVAIQRGNQFGPSWVGDAFIPESAGSVVAHFALESEGTTLRAEHRVYDDPTWGKREFLASDHERFRPVDVKVGPDGALWVIDMYRGVIQHAQYVSDHLRTYIKENDLEAPGATGRIWRIVREDQPLVRQPPALDSPSKQLLALDHPNGWVRDRAQRLLAHERKPTAISGLRRLANRSPLGHRHALWTLDRMGELDFATWQRALDAPEPETRVVALRISPGLLPDATGEVTAAITRGLEDPEPQVRLTALQMLGAMPAEQRPLSKMIEQGRGGDPLFAQAAISGLDQREQEALRAEISAGPLEPNDETRRLWLADLASATHFASQRPDANARDALLNLIAEQSQEEMRHALLLGIDNALRSPGNQRVSLRGPHLLFAEENPTGEPPDESVQRVRRGFTWPGDPRPGGARALTLNEEVRRKQGEELYTQVCAACHAGSGRGIADQAPSLVGSPWVRDSEDWLIRIVLDGMTGPVEIDGEAWDRTMPGHRDNNEHMDDEALAGLFTYLRRAWGHAEDPVTAEAVEAVRSATRDRKMPWTANELRDLQIQHRLDRYAGAYTIPIIGTELLVVRQDSQLAVGQRGTGKGRLDEAGDGFFYGQGVSIQFRKNDDDEIAGAELTYSGMSISVDKTE